MEKNNPDKVRESSRKRRAKKAQVEENFTKEMETFIYKQFNNQCFNCKSTDYLGIYHHHCLNDGYPLIISNATLLCLSCNSSKKTKKPIDFYDEETFIKITIKIAANNMLWQAKEDTNAY